MQRQRNESEFWRCLGTQGDHNIGSNSKKSGIIPRVPTGGQLVPSAHNLELLFLLIDFVNRRDASMKI